MKLKYSGYYFSFPYIFLFYFSVSLISLSFAQPYRLPEAPLQEDADSIVTINRIKINQFTFTGNSIFSDQELSDITKNYRNKLISIEQLMEVKQLISRHYIDKGYINSGAVLADQKISSGIVKFTIIEGVLSTTEIHGNNKISSSYIQNKLAAWMPNHALAESDKQVPLNLFKLQQSLKLLEQDPLIDKINAQLTPGLIPGQSNLSLGVVEAQAYQLSFVYNNYRVPSVGSTQGRVQLKHNNLFGSGETFFLDYGLLNAQDDFLLAFSMPLDANKTAISLSYEKTSDAVIQAPFEQLKFENDLSRLSINLSHRLHHSLSTEVSLGALIRQTGNETRLRDELFDFIAGTAKVDVNEIGVYLNWVERNSEQVLAATGELDFAYNSIYEVDSEPVTNLLDDYFTRFKGQFHWLQNHQLFNFTDKTESLFRVNLQLTNTNVLPVNQFSVGGVGTVRGYRENSLIRDNGIAVSYELHIPISKISFAGINNSHFSSQLSLVPFIDYAYVWNVDNNFLPARELYSVGLGLQWKVDKKLAVDLYWGEALTDLDIKYDGDLQDKGIHFQMRFNLF